MQEQSFYQYPDGRVYDTLGDHMPGEAYVTDTFGTRIVYLPDGALVSTKPTCDWCHKPVPGKSDLADWPAMTWDDVKRTYVETGQVERICNTCLMNEYTDKLGGELNMGNRTH